MFSISPPCGLASILQSGAVTAALFSQCSLLCQLTLASSEVRRHAESASESMQDLSIAIPSQNPLMGGCHSPGQSLGMHCFRQILRIIFGTSKFSKYARYLSSPIYVDMASRLLLYSPIYENGVSHFIEVPLDEFPVYFDFAFTFFTPLANSATRDIENLFRTIEKCCAICTPKYRAKLRTKLHYNMLFVFSTITDYSKFREVRNYQIPARAFHQFLMSTYSLFKIARLNTLSDDGRAEYSLAGTGRRRAGKSRASLSMMYVFAFYASNIRELDLSLFKYRYHLSADPAFIQILGACKIRRLTVPSESPALLDELFLTSAFDGSEERAAAWPELRHLTVTGPRADSAEITRECRSEDARIDRGYCVRWRLSNGDGVCFASIELF